MSVAYVIEFRVKVTERARFLGLLTELLRTMRAEASFVAATLHADPADPLRFLLHEIWQDHAEVVGVQLHRPYRAAWHAALPELLIEERRIATWTPLAVEAMTLVHSKGEDVDILAGEHPAEVNRITRS